MHNPIRYTATICIEITTPLSIGSGFSGLTNDRLIARDANNLPYIPGSSIAGALRDAVKGYLDVNKYFGHRRNTGSAREEEGSRLIFSSAHLVMLNGMVADGLVEPDNKTKAVYETLPSRDHVRINDKGVAIKHGKFEEELLLAGSRFVFSIEMVGNGSTEEEEDWRKLLGLLTAPYLRMGGGTRKGFGAYDVVALEQKKFDLRKKNAEGDLLSANDYLNYSSKLRLPSVTQIEEFAGSQDYIHYKLELEPCDFFFFGGQELDINENILLGEQDAKFILGVDDNFKTEKVVEWSADGKGCLSEKQALIPATSVKGALSHRVAFYYNKEMLKRVQEEQPQLNPGEKIMAELEDLANIPDGTPADSLLWEDRISKIEALQWTDKKIEHLAVIRTGEQNEAVIALFGRSAELDENQNQLGRKGSVIIEDFYITSYQEKIFDHVKIDRFTGGASDGALFQEKTITTSEKIELIFWVEKSALNNGVIEQAWEAALKDVANGLLPLGGKTTKGHGLFKGNVYKNNQLFYDHESN